MDGHAVFHRSDGVKAQTSFGNIGYDPAIVERQIDVRESFQCFPFSKTTFLHSHKHAPRPWPRLACREVRLVARIVERAPAKRAPLSRSLYRLRKRLPK